jgi:hypothetical protein
VTAETYHFRPGDILFLVIGQGSAVTLDKLVDPPEVTDGAFTGGILCQIGSLHRRGRREQKQNRQKKNE